MANNLVVVKVKVEELTKWGFKAKGKFVNFSKKFAEEDKTKVIPGAEFEAEYFIADSGKEYLNKILNMSVAQPAEQTSTSLPSVQEPVKKFEPTFKKEKPLDNTMSKADWSAKDRSMLVGGIFHDASVVCAALINVEGLDAVKALETFRTLAEGMIAIRDGIK